ncbi:septation protein SpoVG family protein [Candidatus Dependentiae bacterium]|nr:septation protein SpoVG family protein [Candidatus Dependentiae bacterium]
MKALRIFLIIALIFSFLVVGCAKPEKDTEVVERKILPTEEKETPVKVETPIEPAPEKKPVVKTETPPKETKPTVKEVKPVQKPVEPVKEPEAPKEYTVKVTGKEDLGNGLYKITLNNQIELIDVKVRDDGSVVFPYSTSNDKRYYFIWFDDIELMKHIKKSIANGDLATDADELEITGVDFKHLDRKTLKGFGKVQFNNSFWINSFPLFVGGKRGDGISMPSVKGDDGKYHSKVEIPDAALKEKIESKILQKYNEK